MLLLTMNPEGILDFFRRYPCDMKDAYREVVGLKTPGDVMSPTPVMDSFFRQLAEREGNLMTQQEFCAFHLSQQQDEVWFASLSPFVQQCYVARLYRQFYVSAIDSLYMWALLGTRYLHDGTLVFDRCIIDTKQDVVLKTDLLLYRGEECLRVALTTNTLNASRINAYKRTHRGHAAPGIIEIRMKVGPKLRGIGNKCWLHWPDDFTPIFRKATQLFLW